MSTMTNDTPRIYVASLTDYNAGLLHGAWVDATDEDTIQEAIAEMLSTSPTAARENTVAEEYAIHDHDNFYGISVGEYEDVAKLAEMASLLEEHGPAFAAYADYVGAEYVDALGFEESYAGEYDNEKDFAYNLVDDLGLLDGVDQSVAMYFDYDAFARDLFMSDYYAMASPSGPGGPGGIYVFRSN